MSFALVLFPHFPSHIRPHKQSFLTEHCCSQHIIQNVLSRFSNLRLFAFLLITRLLSWTQSNIQGLLFGRKDRRHGSHPDGKFRACYKFVFNTASLLPSQSAKGVQRLCESWRRSLPQNIVSVFVLTFSSLFISSGNWRNICNGFARYHRHLAWPQQAFA